MEFSGKNILSVKQCEINKGAVLKKFGFRIINQKHKRLPVY